MGTIPILQDLSHSVYLRGVRIEFEGVAMVSHLDVDGVTIVPNCRAVKYIHTNVCFILCYRGNGDP